ncbi:Period circadian protein [Penicillium odoratum]|uniref:Period circadian protein n=1 Tax=Penicillium odoratum TaxID=1167516 RepID=UPI0025485A0A|nr:Period circadian protein [Penicillium odoratum]KAJ5745433.1 Period circadian protein [Penicillium odoratum]
MQFKSTIALAFVALASIVAASTPACIISVMGDTANPDDLKTICGSKTIQSTIESKCGNNAQAGLKFFCNTCKSAGYTVVTSSNTAGTATATGATGTATGFATAVSTSGSKTTGASTSGSGSASASGSASGSASAFPSPSTAGAAGGQHLSSTAFVAAMFFGAAAIL